MSKLIQYVLLITLSLFSWQAHSAIKGEEISYKAGDTTLKGYITWDDAIEGKRPGVLVVHEWWGHNDYARKRADQLAGLGYTAMAVDMYGDGKQADHPKKAKEFMMAVTKAQGLVKERFEVALNELKKHSTVEGDKVSAVGYCFGGGVVLGMARSGMDLDGVASFHGGLNTETPAAKGSVKAKILVLHGNDDKMITAEHVDAFKKEMDAAEAEYEFVGYDKAPHSFTNPAADEVGKKFDMPVGYNKEADEDSWNRLKAFLAGLYK